MAVTNRCRLRIAAILRRTQSSSFLLSPAPSLPRRSHNLSDFGGSPGYVSLFGGCLNPSHGGVLGSRTLVRHFSWWRWGGSNSVPNLAIQPEDGEGEAIREVRSSDFRQEDEVVAGEKNPEPYASSSDGLGSGELSWQRRKDEMEENFRPLDGGVPSIDTDSLIFEDSGGSAFWSTLQVPVDAIIGALDRFQNVIQVPWWFTIIGSTLALRAALFPLTVTQLQKASVLARLGSQLPPPIPPPGSGISMASQYRIFTKRRLELGAPSPAWLVAVPLIQVPLFIYWIVAVRQMAIASHPGFDTGGILWFTDLTVPVQGALGALFPIIVAATYFTNLQLSFKGIEQQKGIMGTVMKFYKWWLEAATIPAFIFGFYLPQGVFMYWITNNCCSLAQTVALRQPGVRAVLGLPSLAELSKLRSSSPSPPPPPPEANLLKLEAVENMSSDDLLVLAANSISMKREDEALEVLHHTVKKFPDKVEALFALGKIYSGRQLWHKASEYHGLVLQKTKEKELIIAASLGAGVALFKLGKRSEALEIMSVFTQMDVPQDPLSQHRYFKACIALSSVLSQEGRKAEALVLLKKAAKYEPMVEKVLIPQLEKELQEQT